MIEEMEAAGSDWEEVEPAGPGPACGEGHARDIAHAWRRRIWEPSHKPAARRRARVEERLQVSVTLINGPIQLGDDVKEITWMLTDEGPVGIDLRGGEVLEAAPGEGMAYRFAFAHWLGAQPENQWASEVEAQKGQPFLDKHGRVLFQSLGGALWIFPSRLNTDHMESIRRGSRKKARLGVRLGNDSLTPKERFLIRINNRARLIWRFLTLTLPPIPGLKALGRLGEARLIQRAWSLFRKRLAFLAHVRGYIKGVEQPQTLRGSHTHIHAMILGRYWDKREIRDEWWSCVEAAAKKELGIELDQAEMEAATGMEGGVGVKIQLVKSRRESVRDPEKEIAEEDAVLETIKYVTKGDDYLLMEAEDLLSIELVKRWPRMFEVGGVCREARKAKVSGAPKEGDADPSGEARACLDTSCISDGGPSGEPSPLPFAEGELKGVDPQKPLPEAPAGAPEASKDPPPKFRPPTWRELLYTLSLGDWLRMLLDRARRAQKFRAKALGEMFTGILCTMDGRVFGATGRLAEIQ